MVVGELCGPIAGPLRLDVIQTLGKSLSDSMLLALHWP